MTTTTTIAGPTMILSTDAASIVTLALALTLTFSIAVHLLLNDAAATKEESFPIVLVLMKAKMVTFSLVFDVRRKGEHKEEEKLYFFQHSSSGKWRARGSRFVGCQF